MALAFFVFYSVSFYHKKGEREIMKTNKLIALLLSLLIGFNTVGVCYGEEVENEAPVVEENTGNESDKQFYGYVPSDLDYNTPVIDQSNSGIAPIGTLVPSSYQYDINEIKAKYPDVRNQDPYGTCWSFSSMGMMEFDLINKGQFTRNNDLSELQLAYFTFNNVQDPLGGTKGDTAKYYNENASNTYLNYGGNYEYSIRRLSQWISATNESVVPYTNAANTITNGLDSSLAYNYNSAYLKNAYLINIKQNPDNVKEMIMKHGSVGVMYNHRYDGMTQINGVNAYFDNGKQTNAGGTHAVMIVGWDDNYSKDNFQTAEKPTKNGAWLVRNSWGIYFSYFWMSYETSSLSDTAYAFDCQSTKPYDNNYQLDGGLESYLYTNASSVYNKFTVQKTDGVESETLKAISVSFTKAANVNYTIDIYTSMYDKGKPETGTKVASISDKTTYAGVYTIPLGTQNEVKLKPGSELYVVVTTDKPAVDCETAYSIVDDPNSENPKSIWSKAVSQYDYNSYFKIDGSTRYQASQNNFRIKAYTTNNSKTQKDISNAVITKNDDFTLDNPSVKVTYEGVELKKGTDYTISTTKDANGITVTVSGQGDFIGNKSVTFERNVGETYLSHSLSLNGLIELNMYFDLNSTLKNDQKAYALFILPDGREQKVYVKDAEYTEGKGYRFACGLYAKEMTQDVTVKFVDSKGQESKGYKKSVKGYADAIFKKYEGTYGKDVQVLKSMLNYGGNAQRYFGYNTNNNADVDVSSEFKNQMDSLEANELEKYNYTVTGSDSNVSFNSFTLVCEAATSLRLYFKFADDKYIDSYTPTVNGKKVEFKKSNTGYYIEIENIYSNKLDTNYNVQVGNIKVNCYPLSYCYLVLKKQDSLKTKTVDLAKSIYIYYLNSKERFG